MRAQTRETMRSSLGLEVQRQRRGLHGESGFRKAIGHFDLLAVHIDENDMPGVLGVGMARLIGDQVKWLVTLPRM